MAPLPLLALACRGPDPAPGDVDALSAWLYARQDAGTDAELAEGLANLLSVAAGLDLSDGADPPTYAVSPLDRAVVEGLVEHDRDPADTVGVGVFHLSPHAVDAHAGVLVLEDQTVVEPDAVSFRRTLLDATADCWLARDCLRVSTYNEVERENLLYEAAYVVYKDLRWVPLEDGGWAVVSRSWLPASANTDGLVPIWQSYDLDLYVASGGGTLRWHVTWQETDVPGVGDEGVASVVALGIADMYEAWEDWLDRVDPLP